MCRTLSIDKDLLGTN